MKSMRVDYVLPVYRASLVIKLCPIKNASINEAFFIASEKGYAESLIYSSATAPLVNCS